MNRLDDLRQTLDHHAADLDGSTLDHASRRTSLDGRIAVHRRRRTVVRGTVAGAAALALVGVVVLPLVDEATSERGVGPVDRTVLGEKAPAAIRPATAGRTGSPRPSRATAGRCRSSSRAAVTRSW
ncbi:MAG: hypothetical protein ACI379_00450 [Nocardioides sp.]|uniref:hypothetical protein n=1 Tax=Nocardioides sp. TaxID=35761 RepID=UPI003F08BC64